MISDARGGHVSPGVYTEEREVTYSVKSLGITNLGLAGETVKGPAFQPISISSWSDFTDYFGGTSPEKFKGNGRPKYELPYIAKSYLQESKKLQVVRVLGLSGYKTSPAYVVKATFGDEEYPLVILRSQVSLDASENQCVKSKYEQVRPWVTSMELVPYSGSSFNGDCVSVVGETIKYPLEGVIISNEDGDNYVIDAENPESGMTVGKFSLVVKYKDASKNEQTMIFNVSLDSNDTDYIYNVIPATPTTKANCPIFVEAVYDYAYQDMVNSHESGTTVTISMDEPDESTADYREPFRCAVTPWIVSEVKSASEKEIDLKRLFKFYTISDGNASNYQVKISIQNIDPDTNTFDVVIRDFYDYDESPVVLEKFTNCSLEEGTSNYIGLKIGTVDGGYASKSKYVTVLINEDEDGLEKCVPAGFLGYPMPKYGCKNTLKMAYNTVYDTNIKPKKQYFGLNINILDNDVLNYKGVDAYSDYDSDPAKLTNGFHLDAILSDNVRNASGSILTNSVILVDGISGLQFTTTIERQNDVTYTAIPRIIAGGYMDNTIYSDKKLRKFTVYPYGGFDAWDIYRTYRTNGDAYKITKYAMPETESGLEDCPFKYCSFGEGAIALNPQLNLNLPSKAITSDYYAYLGAYNQFANPQDIDINLFATPGIDWYNNSLLVGDALEIVEDPDDGRGGDCLYIVTTPQYTADGDTLSEDEVVELLDSNPVSSSYACTYYPWVQYYDSSEKKYLNLPVTKDVVRDMAQTDNNLFPWYSPAGTSRGSVECVKAYKKTTLASEDTLYGATINPVKTFAEDGVLLWGNKTMYNVDSPLNRINVRRLMIRVKKLITSASKDLIFEQYDATLEKQFKSLVEPILKNVQENRGISDFRIETECTAETRDQHILPAKILIKPINALEYISISFVVYPESVSFDE